MNKIEEIKKQLAVIAKVDAITDEMKLSELGLDSLDVVELLLQLEEQYDIHFDDIDMSNFKTVGDLLASIEQKLKK
ncbi:MAG: phosphopantetheine-binding protein [Bacillales bacterium]|nr:phosphopantetheine-binding protein [Bacillales bacterium]MDY6002770.1 phosphopantetheine-binding protein [Bacilli bacterium]